MKKLKLKYNGAALLLSSVIISAFLIPIFQTNENNLKNEVNSIKTSDFGVSNYTIIQSVTYKVEVEISITQNQGYGDWYFKYPRLNDRQPDSSLTEYTPPYQESQLLSSVISDGSFLEIDEFNNTYDLFNVTNLYQDTISLHQIYNVTLNQIKFGDIENLNIDMSDYNYSNPMFELYCNKSKEYYDINDPDLIALSNSVAAGYQNPAMKAKKILEWIDNNLNYESKMPEQEIGASEAYDTLEGDCSEFSSLAVTLMRIQKIPARKVTGLLISSNSNFQPTVGYTKTFSQSGGHAWVEYYIPTIGWVSCEPQRSDLWKTSSYLTFTQNIGEWFTFPNASQPLIPENISEFTTLYTGQISGLPPYYNAEDAFDWHYSVKVTVTDSNFLPGPDIIAIIIWVSIIGIVVVVSIVIIRAIVIRKRRNKNAW